ncbi:GNAT family N-acetyltransferase [Phenylobacterium sp.]|uniref:GNAT family N-acetyltransferase n=1 Tax=Phenylobacterium sp. TaxID=1871053 RepID=UPI0035B4BEDF
MGWPERHRGGDGSLTIQIRFAREDDLPRLPVIEQSAAQAFRALEVPYFELISQLGPVDTWRPALEAGTLWVADDGDGPVGFLAATREGDRLHIDEFDVMQDQQGRGLGRRMMGAVIAWARREGVARLTLTTFSNIAWNAPFYTSFGFRPLGDDMPEDLRAILAREAARGLPDRVAMELAL